MNIQNLEMEIPLNLILSKSKLQTRVVRERREAAAAHDADRGQDETAAGRHNLLLCRSGEKEEITAWLFRVKSAIYTQFGLSWTLKIMKLSHFIHT